ncbi:unnamed protein product [Scytosiphon promiscuus]
MKKAVPLACCVALLTLDGSRSFVSTNGKPSPLSTAPARRRATAAADPRRHMATHCSTRRDATATQRRSFPVRQRTLDTIGGPWIRKATSVAVAVCVLVGASVADPAAAAAGVQSPTQEPVVQALVQLPDEEADWTKLLSDAGQAPGARMVITASKERGGKPSLGASIAMNKLRFPVMLQLFPRNAIGGASWPVDFQEQGTFAVEVVVCGAAGDAKGAVCESPLPIVGSGESVFVTGLEGVPEVADSGGMRVPATVILSNPSARILAPAS